MKWLSIFLILGVLLGPFSAYSEPQVSASGVTLSIAEYDQILEAMEAADKALVESSKQIKAQETSLKRLWIFSALLGGALVLDATAEIIEAIRR